jgi:hypothetical protein
VKTFPFFVAVLSAVTVLSCLGYAVYLGWRDESGQPEPEPEDTPEPVETSAPYDPQAAHILQGFDGSRWTDASLRTFDLEKLDARVAYLRAKGDLRRYRVIRRTVTWETVWENPDENAL